MVHVPSTLVIGKISVDNHLYLKSSWNSVPGARVIMLKVLYKHICQPSLTYGLECINIPHRDLQSLNTVQGKRIKQSLGLSKHSHNTQLMHGGYDY